MAFAIFGPLLAANDTAPIIDLNGILDGLDYTATFTEDDGTEPVVSTTGLTITDSDSSTLSWVKVTLSAAPDGAAESLSASAGATGIVVKYKPASRTLELSGVYSLSSYQEVLRTVAYLNESQAPDISDRTILFQASDGTEQSAPATSTVSINAVNDAPVLDNTGNMALVDINENVFTSLGNRVETIIDSAGGDRITDPDANSLEGLAIIEVGSSNGAWQYSLDAGATWVTFENVTNQTATVLNPTARIRFVPKPQFNGSASITFRAWDQTQALNGDTGVDLTMNGGTTAYSLATETAVINVIPVNDSPVVDLNGPDQGQNFSAGYLSAGVPIPIADPEATITDPDSQLLTTATLKLTNRLDDTFELLAASVLSTSITIVPYDPTTGELVLNGPDTVQAFQQVLRSANYVNLAVEPQSGTRVVEVTASDGTTSSAVVTATIQINLDNQAPTLNAPSGISLNSVAEDALDPPGTTIGSMLAGAGDPIADPDPGALEGIAIVGAGISHGTWQYATEIPAEGSPMWLEVGVVSDTAALLLNPEALIRFVPLPDYAGPSDSLTFRAWDQTTGTNGQRNVNTSVNGGSSAFSMQTAVASLIVSPINDAPVISYTPGGPLVYQEDAAPLSILNNSLVLSDVDSVNLASATVTLVNRPNGDAETLSVDPGGSGLSVVLEEGVLLISGPATLATYREVLTTLTYDNASQDPNVANRQIQVVVNDGTTSSAPLPLTVSIIATNDQPIVDLNGAGSGVDFSTDFFIQWRPVRIADPNMVVIDQDDTSLLSIQVRIVNPLDGSAEGLTARVLGTNIKKAYDPVSGILFLTGIDSVSNYQQVLRTVTYNNVLESPTEDVRTVEFKAQDAQDTGPVSRALVSIQPTPTANVFMPISIGRRSEEPNDRCSEALSTPIDTDALYYADDEDDWFYFDLPANSLVSVNLSGFVQGKGQLIVAAGANCSSLELIGNNGDDQPNKTVNIGQRTAGRYYIWIINEEVPNMTSPYTLRINTSP